MIDVSQGMSRLASGGEYPIATASGGINAVPAIQCTRAGYSLCLSGDGKSLLLRRDPGTQMVIR